MAVSVLAACAGGSESSSSQAAASESSNSEIDMFEDFYEEDGPIEETAQAEPVTGEGATPFAIYNEEKGIVVRLGDKRADVEKIFGDSRMIMEFTEVNVDRTDYWDFPGVEIEYDLKDGTVRALRVSASSTGWKIFNGVNPGNPAEAAMENYKAEHIYTYVGSDEVHGISYDKGGNSVTFSDASDYLVRLNVVESKIETIVIEDNAYFREFEQ